MALEVVVRPVVFPNIRPQAPRSLPPASDPHAGICEIKGTSSFIVNFSTSASFSVTYGKNKEVKRRVDVARVYQQSDDGTVNKDNFVDVEVANKIWKRGGAAPGIPTPEKKSQAEIDQRARDARAYEAWVEYFKKVEEGKNIEIRKRNLVIENTEKPQS